MREFEKQSVLSGVRVLEVADGLAVGYAGRLFAESGANVVKLSRAPHRTSLFRDMKKHVVTVFGEVDMKEIIEECLSKTWDIVLWDSRLPFDMDQFITRSITSHRRKCIGIRCILPEEDADMDEEAVLQALSGWMELTGDPDRPPLTIGGRPAVYLVGAHAATAGMLALLEREWSRYGRLIEIHAMTVAASALEGAISSFLADQVLPRRPGNRHRSLAPMVILPSADGWIFVGAPVDEQWELIVRWAGLSSRPEWTIAERRREECQQLERILSQWTRTITRQELFLSAQTFRLPFGNVQNLEEVRGCQHLKARQFWMMTDKGAVSMRLPWKMEFSPFANHDPCHDIASWKGLRIIDLTSMWSGPYCTRLFADLGAEVIKVEAPHRPDGMRGRKDASSPFFMELNRNKLGIQLDLRLLSDRQKLRELIAVSDVLVENYSPRVMPNFGLGKEELWKIRPDLVIVSLSAFGQTGPYRNFVGYGPTLEAMSGLASLTHYPDGVPWLPGFSVSDIAAGIHGAFALAMALILRKWEGRGVWMDVSQYETACQLVGDHLTEKMEGGVRFPPKTIQGITELVRNGQVRMMKLADGKMVLGTPWESEGWEAPCSPPTEVVNIQSYFLNRGELR